MLEKLYGWSFNQAAKEIDAILGAVMPAPIGNQQTQASKMAALRRVWGESTSVSKGDPVWLYLNRRAGVEVVPPDLRFHPALRHTEGGEYPAMVAMMRYPDGRAASLHRTYLTKFGQKAPVESVKKFMAGLSLQTACVRLSEVATSIAHVRAMQH